jgi:hypothetical protein
MGHGIFYSCSLSTTIIVWKDLHAHQEAWYNKLGKNDTLNNNKNKYTNVQLTPNDNPYYEVMVMSIIGNLLEWINHKPLEDKFYLCH